MDTDSVLDHQPVTGGDTSIVGRAGEYRCEWDSKGTGLGYHGDHASVDAGNQASETVAGGSVSKRRFESTVPTKRGETAKIVRQLGTPWCIASPEPR
jgi:hypothetical protein